MRSWDGGMKKGLTTWGCGDELNWRGNVIELSVLEMDFSQLKGPTKALGKHLSAAAWVVLVDQEAQSDATMLSMAHNQGKQISELSPCSWHWRRLPLARRSGWCALTLSWAMRKTL